MKQIYIFLSGIHKNTTKKEMRQLSFSENNASINVSFATAITIKPYKAITTKLPSKVLYSNF